MPRFAVFGTAGFGFCAESFLPLPTTEIFPVELDKSSFVKTFLGFLVSVETVESCSLEGGGGRIGICAL